MKGNEDEVPPQTKIRIVATIDEKLVAKMKDIHEVEIKFACEEDRVEPDWSNTIEMLLRKGVKAYKSGVPPQK
jgi:hypothetical protein